MIELVKGDIFRSPAQALVNPVNCVGVMGKGLALQFKERFPENFRAYQAVCMSGELVPGVMLSCVVGVRPWFVINFPTKRHWRDHSRLEDIELGLEALVAEIYRLGVLTVAVPALGCGNGGLPWRQVLPRIERAFEPIRESVYVFVHQP